MPVAPPSAVVIFGASGDLAKRKLIPALYELARQKMLSDKFVLVGYSRSEMSDEQYRQECREAVQKFARTKPVDEAILKRIENATFYVRGDYGTEADFARLKEKLAQLDGKFGTAGNRLFYLSTPPNTFEPIITCLGQGRDSSSKAWERIIIEKPFGRDLQSAKSLNALLH